MTPEPHTRAMVVDALRRRDEYRAMTPRERLHRARELLGSGRGSVVVETGTGEERVDLEGVIRDLLDLALDGPH